MKNYVVITILFYMLLFIFAVAGCGQDERFYSEDVPTQEHVDEQDSGEEEVVIVCGKSEGRKHHHTRRCFKKKKKKHHKKDRD